MAILSVDFLLPVNK